MSFLFRSLRLSQLSFRKSNLPKYFSGTNSVIVKLQNDNAGLPGSTIETYTISNIPSTLTTSDNLSVAFSVSDPTYRRNTILAERFPREGQQHM